MSDHYLTVHDGILGISCRAPEGADCRMACTGECWEGCECETKAPVSQDDCQAREWIEADSVAEQANDAWIPIQVEWMGEGWQWTYEQSSEYLLGYRTCQADLIPGTWPPNQADPRPCIRQYPHPAHKHMISRGAYQCPGRSEPTDEMGG